MKFLVLLFCSCALSAYASAQTVNANSVVFADPTLGGNGDFTAIYRSDLMNDYTRLRMQLGDEETALFEMGYPYYSTGQWTNIFTVDGNGNGYFKGNLGIGIAVPSAWFPGRVMEMIDTRPILKLSSSSSTGLSTILFTNTSINPSSHVGEFHLNHSFNAGSPDQSKMSFGSYPSGSAFEIRADGHVAILDNKQLRLRGLASGESALGFDAPTETVRLSSTKDNYDRFIALGGYSGSTWTQQLTLNTKTGRVGIGTKSPDQMLTVKGKIHAEEVIVDLSVPAPDYVFEQSYPLTPLDEVQAYIAQHKHLPEVPSAKEMEKDGVKVGEMEMVLLKKVEELTLYILELRKEKNELAAQVKQLTAEVTQLKTK